MGTKYVILSPAYNEEEFIEKTIKSVISQTIKPVEWIIINDGSTDQTKNIIEKYVSQIKWISLVNRSAMGYRPGHGVVDAFYDGLSKVKSTDWEFIVKLDGDVSFNESYFEEIFKRFAENTRLGIASGKTYYPNNNELILEDCTD
jgi:glycosyltransferase involved in cell wall biosynthesis